MEKICEKCNGVLVHQNEYSMTHETCFCYLMGFRGICCQTGFRNLIIRFPCLSSYFMAYFNMPQYYNSDVLYTFDKGSDEVCISEERRKLIKEGCKEILNELQYLTSEFIVLHIVRKENDPYYFDNYLNFLK